MASTGTNWVRIQRRDVLAYYIAIILNVVCLALLTGSDYTEGVETVGPVTAMEILAEFPGDGLAPLQEFAAWRGRVGAGLGGEVVGSRAREKLRRLQLPVSFPSLAVQAAYLQPSVDTSTQPFSWAVPNLVAVRSAPVLMFGPFYQFELQGLRA